MLPTSCPDLCLCSRLIARAAAIINVHKEEDVLVYPVAVLFEYQGEDFPDTRGSIICALKEIVTVAGLIFLKHSALDLLPRLTLTLKHDKKLCRSIVSW